MDRGQLPLSVIEASIGLVLLLAIAATFTLGVAPAETATGQLDRYAADAATILANEEPEHANQTRLAEVSASPGAFERERASLRRRADRILPDNVMFRIETRQGTIGYDLPPDVPTGTATVATGAGDVTLRVWYV